VAQRAGGFANSSASHKIARHNSTGGMEIGRWDLRPDQQLGLWITGNYVLVGGWMASTIRNSCVAVVLLENIVTSKLITDLGKVLEGEVWPGIRRTCIRPRRRRFVCARVIFSGAATYHEKSNVHRRMAAKEIGLQSQDLAKISPEFEMALAINNSLIDWLSRSIACP
jgi:hypothetical protein